MKMNTVHNSDNLLMNNPPTPTLVHEDELTLVYMSIETLKNRILVLEAENTKLIEQRNKERYKPAGYSGDVDSERHGYNGHEY
jgi:hypothetical protein